MDTSCLNDHFSNSFSIFLTEKIESSIARMLVLYAIVPEEDSRCSHEHEVSYYALLVVFR